MPNSFWRPYIALHCSIKMYSKKRKKDVHYQRSRESRVRALFCTAVKALVVAVKWFSAFWAFARDTKTMSNKPPLFCKKTELATMILKKSQPTCEYRMRLWQAAEVSEALLASNAFWAWLSAKATSAKSARPMANWLTFWLCRTSCKLAWQHFYLQIAIFHTRKILPMNHFENLIAEPKLAVEIQSFHFSSWNAAALKGEN